MPVMSLWTEEIRWVVLCADQNSYLQIQSHRLPGGESCEKRKR